MNQKTLEGVVLELGVNVVHAWAVRYQCFHRIRQVLRTDVVTAADVVEKCQSAALEFPRYNRFCRDVVITVGLDRKVEVRGCRYAVKHQASEGISGAMMGKLQFGVLGLELLQLSMKNEPPLSPCMLLQKHWIEPFAHGQCVHV